MKEIVGTFVYQLHGCVHMGNIFNGMQEPNRTLRYGEATVNLNGQREGFELPAMTAFHPSHFPQPPQIPIGSPAYTPEAGFYPYSEIGVMMFANDGGISASSRLNTSGYLSLLLQFEGRYLFDAPGGGLGHVERVQDLATGQFTLIHNQDPRPLIWDYTFAFINKDEALLMAGGRSPRPATLTGRM